MPGLTIYLALCATLLLPAITSAQQPPPPAAYDKSVFQNPIPPDQLTFLMPLNGAPAKDLVHDKQFKKLMKSTLPGWMFHYSTDMSVSDAMDHALGDSRQPVSIRDGRYLTASGQAISFSAHPEGRGLIWIDLQDGIVLSAFYFHPGNGEPTPTITVFSKQLKTDTLAMSQLPLAFAADLKQWAEASHLPPLTTRYFIGALNKRILLEHDENFCGVLYADIAPTPQSCQQMTADAVDLDMNTAYYLEQVHYATNATARMVTGEDQTAFLRLREHTCGGIADPLGCRVRLTREHVHVVQTRRR
jgi:hypothetical protein